jgi:acetyl esterase/lipase
MPWPKGALVVVKVSRSLKSKQGTPYSSHRHVFSFIVDNGVDRGVKEALIPTIKKTNNGVHNIPLQLVLPKRSGPFPVVFWVHGGGWSGGTATESVASAGPFAEYFAKHLGVATAGVAYRCKGSKGSFSLAMEDVLDAYQWTEDNSEKFNLDIERIGFAGGSAGAQLSSLAAQRAPKAICYLGFNGKYNLELDPKRNAFGKNIPSPRANSAICNLKNPPPDTILFHGSADTTADPQQSVLFAEAIERAGGRARVVLYAGEPHAFFNAGKQMSIPVLYEAKEHLKRVFRLEE